MSETKVERMARETAWIARYAEAEQKALDATGGLLACSPAIWAELEAARMQNDTVILERICQYCGVPDFTNPLVHAMGSVTIAGLGSRPCLYRICQRCEQKRKTNVDQQTGSTEPAP